MTTTNGETFCNSAGVGVALLVIGVVYLALIVLSIIATVKVVTKAGYSGWWVLIMLVPLVNFVMMLVFAFSEWPVLRELQVLRAQRGGFPGRGPLSRWGSGGFPGGTSYGGGAGGPGSSGSPPSGSGGALTVDPSAGPAGREPLESDVPLPSFWNFQPEQGAFEPHGPASEPWEPATSGPTPDLPPASPGGPPAGWYPTPDGRQRYWDGRAWTDHFA